MNKLFLTGVILVTSTIVGLTLSVVKTRKNLKDLEESVNFVRKRDENFNLKAHSMILEVLSEMDDRIKELEEEKGIDNSALYS